MSPADAGRARLSLNLSGREVAVPLGDTVVVVGSADDCDLRLSGSAIAPQHLAVRRQDNRYVCAVVAPGLLFHHNGEKVTDCTLQHGDRIGLGPIELTFTEPQAIAQLARVLPGRIAAWAREPGGQSMVLAIAFAAVALLATWAARAGAEAAWRSQLASRHLLEAQLAALDLQGAGLAANDLASTRLVDWVNRLRARGVVAGDAQIAVWRADGEPLFPQPMPENLRRVHDFEAWPRQPQIAPRGGGGDFARVTVFGRDLRPQAHVGILWEREQSPMAGMLAVLGIAVGVGIVAALVLTRYARRNLGRQLDAVADSIAAFGHEGGVDIANPDPTLPEWARLAHVAAQRCRLVQAGAVTRTPPPSTRHPDGPAWWDAVCAVSRDPVLVLDAGMRVAAFNAAAAALPFGPTLSEGTHMVDLLQACPDLQGIGPAFDSEAATATYEWAEHGRMQVHVLYLADGAAGGWRVFRFATGAAS